MNIYSKHKPNLTYLLLLVKSKKKTVLFACFFVCLLAVCPLDKLSDVARQDDCADEVLGPIIPEIDQKLEKLKNVPIHLF